jgi:replicative DNA helicase
MNEKINNLIIDFHKQIEQLKGKKVTANTVADALSASSSQDILNPDFADYVMSFAKDYGIGENAAELLQVKDASNAGIAAAEIKRQKEEALKKTNNTKESIKEYETILQTEPLDSDKAKDKLQAIQTQIAQLQTSQTTKSRIATWADYEQDIKNYDSNQHFQAKLFGGVMFPCGTVSYIGARTSRGKTTALVNLAREAINNKQRNTLFISLEMSRKDIFNKLILSKIYELAETKKYTLDRENPYSDICWLMKGSTIKNSPNYNHFLECFADAKEFVKQATESEQFIFFDGCGAGVNFEDITNTIIAKAKTINGHAPLVLLDYIQKIPTPSNFNGKDEIQRIACTSAEIINTSIKANVITIAGAQFNRESGKGADGADTFTDASFRSCGDLEQDADNAIGIGWEKDKETRFFEVLKYRQGRPGARYNLKFEGKYAYITIGEKMAQSESKKANKQGKKKIEFIGDLPYGD